MVAWSARTTIESALLLTPGAQYLSAAISSDGVESTEVFAAMEQRGVIEVLREIDGELLEATLTEQLRESPSGVWVGAIVVQAIDYSAFRIRVTNLSNGSGLLYLDQAQSIGSDGLLTEGNIKEDRLGLSVSPASPPIGEFPLQGRSRGAITLQLNNFFPADPPAIVEIQARATDQAEWDRLGELVTINPPSGGSLATKLIHWEGVAVYAVRIKYLSGGGSNTRINQCSTRFEGL